MNNTFSIYLDFLRAAACLTVLVYHAVLPKMTGESFKFPFGSEAVIVFFVLSGIVIAFISSTKENDPWKYFIARFSRLWSVLVPALVVTAAIDYIGMSIDRETYESWGSYIAFDYPLLRLVAAALFLNEIWFLSVVPLSNVPVWSISYEFWYYVIFAAWIFTSGAARFAAVGLSLLIAGPKILLLMPAWLLGVLAYRSLGKVRLGTLSAAFLFCAAPILMVVARHFEAMPLLFDLTARAVGEDFLQTRLWASRNFLWLNIVALLVFVHVMAAHSLSHLFVFPPVAAKAIRWAASFTFSVYLLHHPIQLALTACFSSLPVSLEKSLLVIALSLAASLAIGALLEPLRYPLRGLMFRLRDRWKSPATRIAPTP